MPNLLAHFGVQGPLAHSVSWGSDARWVLLGCIIPDIPWILQRAARVIVPSVDPYALRLYVIVQASLLFSLLLCAGFSVLSTTPRRTILLLGLSALAHLLLDSLERKWANGVHLLAPASWDLLNIGLFWPESPIIYGISGAGVAYAVWAWKQRDGFPAPLLHFSPRRVGAAAMLAAGYFACPLPFMWGPELRDNHYVRTLREMEARPTRYVEFDRRPLTRQANGAILKTFAGEDLVLTGPDLPDAGVISVRGVFVDPKTVSVIEAHAHDGWIRDSASYLGLALFVGILLGLTGQRSPPTRRSDRSAASPGW